MLARRVILCHGFNVRDNGAGTIDQLIPHLTDRGCEVVQFDTGWRGLLGVRYGDAKRAAKLASIVRPGDVLIGHSDGCNVINQAGWLLADNETRKPFAVVYCNPALDSDTPLAPQVKGALVFFTSSDRIVWFSRVLLGHPWGEMGRTGYRAKEEVTNDGRYHNVSYEHLGIDSPGHSGAFKSQRGGGLIVAWVARFLQYLDDCD